MNNLPARTRLPQDVLCGTWYDHPVPIAPVPKTHSPYPLLVFH